MPIGDPSVYYNRRGRLRNPQGVARRQARLEARELRRQQRPNRYLGANKQPRPRDREGFDPAGGANPQMPVGMPAPAPVPDPIAGLPLDGPQGPNPGFMPPGLANTSFWFPPGAPPPFPGPSGNPVPLPIPMTPIPVPPQGPSGPTGGPPININDPSSWLSVLLGAKASPPPPEPPVHQYRFAGARDRFRP